MALLLRQNPAEEQAHRLHVGVCLLYFYLFHCPGRGFSVAISTTFQGAILGVVGEYSIKLPESLKHNKAQASLSS